MASGLSSPLGIAGIIMIIIGIIMAVVGIILLIANQNRSTEWYIWLILIGGIVLGIIGGIMLAIALSQRADDVKCVEVKPPVTVRPPAVTPVPVQQPVQYVVHSPPPVQYITPPPSPVRMAYPTPTITGVSRSYVGTEQFDPDPEKYTVIKQPTPVRTTVEGPYGPGGQRVPTPGVYTPPAEAVTYTTDIPNHPVVSNNPGLGYTRGYTPGYTSTPMYQNPEYSTYQTSGYQAAPGQIQVRV